MSPHSAKPFFFLFSVLLFHLPIPSFSKRTIYIEPTATVTVLSDETLNFTMAATANMSAPVTQGKALVKEDARTTFALGTTSYIQTSASVGNTTAAAADDHNKESEGDGENAKPNKRTFWIFVYVTVVMIFVIMCACIPMEIHKLKNKKQETSMLWNDQSQRSNFNIAALIRRPLNSSAPSGRLARLFNVKKSRTMTSQYTLIHDDEAASSTDDVTTTEEVC